MIKNLLEPDENQPGKTKSETEQAAHESAFEKIAGSHFSETSEAENLHEIPEITIDAPNDLETSDAADTESPAETKIEESRSENSNEMLFQAAAETESIAETTRKSGLAYGAAITLFGSVVFMLILGWFADLLFGTQPWGIVGGIVLGAVVGFFQFFRITSQIFKK
ncbi:MAG: AtpZ/AtpI family protein [Acidobacteriota bacterium]|nr:AtpZ/AtpI family protein [Acidobacteriota bacterium]